MIRASYKGIQKFFTDRNQNTAETKKAANKGEQTQAEQSDKDESKQAETSIQKSLSKFIEKSRTELYKIAEAEKYLSSKDYIEDFLSIPFEGLRDAKKRVKELLSSWQNFRNNGGDTSELAARILFEQQYPSRGYPSNFGRKRQNAEYILQAMDAKKITGKQALQYMDKIFKNELIGDEWTDKQIIEAAKNRYVAERLWHFADIKVEDGKIEYPSEKVQMSLHNYSREDLRTDVSNRLEILKMVSPLDEMYHDWEMSHQGFFVAEQNEPETSEQGEIVYPKGALTYGDKSAVEKFKRGYSDKKFDENNQKKVTVDGREMTRLEVVEGIAKGELEESAMKLNKREREYLEWLQKELFEPLKKIRQAGIQNERANKSYHGMVDNELVYFEGSKDDAATLNQLTKLAETFGGTSKKNSAGNTLFNFPTPKDAWTFLRVAQFFMDNAHLPYFGQERVTKNPLAELKNISLPEGVKLLKVDIAPNSKGVWRVKFVGKFPANEEPAGYNRKQAETNNLFADLARHFKGGLYADDTYHFKNETDARAFKNALDEHLKLKVTAGTLTRAK